MPRSPKEAGEALRSIMSEGVLLVDRVTTTSKRLFSESPGTVAGVFGSFLGASLAYTLSLAIPSVSLLLAGPLGIGLGLTGGILAFWGPDFIRDERRMERDRRRARFLSEEIRKLPKSYPEEMRRESFRQHSNILLGIEGGRIDRGLLPAPEQQE